MHPPANRSLRYWFIPGLLVQLLAAWFSIGYHHPDEHFQVLEWCNYKLGFSMACDLPWEYTARCRPGFQPALAYAIGRCLLIAGAYNPFRLAFLLRVLMALATWLTSCRLVRMLLPAMKTAYGRNALLFSSFFLWFVPYCGVRFSAENVAGISFFLAMSLLPILPGDTSTRRWWQLMSAGLLIGFSLYIRLQMVLAAGTAALWIVCCAKWSARRVISILCAAIAGFFLMILADRWFYGAWVFTPYNYFHVNMIQHIAARYGTEPVWYYFTKFIDIGVPPISVALFIMFFRGLRGRLNHPFTWILVAFIAGHSLIAHKEMRFLFPVLPAFIFLVSTGVDGLMGHRPQPRWYRPVFALIFTCNAIMLLIKIFTPAHEGVSYYQAIYNYSGSRQTVLLSSAVPSYILVGLCVNFYKPPAIKEQKVFTRADIRSALDRAGDAPLLYLNNGLVPDSLIRDARKEEVYCILPHWLEQFNFTNWQSRSYIWKVYRIYR